ncbi:serine hydrolase-domain-containing protein [Aspergillus cavernicola]|uniref:Serine hydrolase-domain-containing protein n=1 Tax=Aspergillus cavernicola TaxID=176166 RepID=A0ABR4INR9_9EURO
MIIDEIYHDKYFDPCSVQDTRNLIEALNWTLPDSYWMTRCKGHLVTELDYAIALGSVVDWAEFCLGPSPPPNLPSHPEGLEFIFPDAPFRFGSDSEESSGLESRAWWLNLDDVSRYIGLEDTLIRLSESLDGRPIHAAVGFSQGGALAAMVTSLCDSSMDGTRRGLLAAQGIPVDTFLKNLPGQQPLEFVVCNWGFRGTMKYYSGFYTSTLTTPSLHIIAALDTLIDEKQGLDIVSDFERLELVYHLDGHYILRDRVFLDRVGQFFGGSCCHGGVQAMLINCRDARC